MFLEIKNQELITIEILTIICFPIVENISICTNVKFRKPYNQFRERKNKLAKRASFKIVFCKCACLYIYTCQYIHTSKNRTKNVFISFNSENSLVGGSLPQSEGHLLFHPCLCLITRSLFFEFIYMELFSLKK